jgi:predicted methyltransferase
LTSPQTSLLKGEGLTKQLLKIKLNAKKEYRTVKYLFILFMPLMVEMRFMQMFFLDPLQVKKLSSVEGFPANISLSLDAGFSETNVEVKRSYLVLPNGEEIPLPDPELLDPEDSRTILIYKENRWQKWQRFDEQSGKFYKMVFVQPGKPPTVEISGIKMHVTKDSDPSLDTRNKLKALGKPGGRVLDTCCGLGYTAITLAALKAVKEVITIEKDSNMVQLCRENPWSRGLFAAEKVTLLRGDAAEKIAEFGDRSFAAILHGTV